MAVLKRFQYITPEDFETAKKNGIFKSTLMKRVCWTYGWDIDRAITQVERSKREVDVTQ